MLYTDFAPMFKAEFFDPNIWAELLAKSGASYDIWDVTSEVCVYSQTAI